MSAAAGADAFEADWRAWHDRHEARLAHPHGFLAITSLRFLDATPCRLPDAPGEWHTGPAGVVVDLGTETLELDGRAIRGRHRFPPLAERDQVLPRWGEAVVEVARRGGHDILRPRHPDNPLRLHFSGVPAFRPDRRWVVTGRYEPFAHPVPQTVGAAVEGLHHVYDAPGEIAFDLDGTHLRVTAFPGRTPGALGVLFTDATAGVTTYPACRCLEVAPAGPDGTVTLDFNRAFNPPCAYTDLATCPLPPPQNRLPVAIEAGEQLPYERRAG